MTRKGYKLIADQLKNFHERLESYGDETAMARICFDQFISNLCTDLKQDNARFDSAKFREAIYGDTNA
jgi:hypothetical protein